MPFSPLIVALTGLTATVADADGRRALGSGRLISNDYLGDGHDRDHTGGMAASRVWGRGWNGYLPQTPGDILELRFHGETLTPDNLVSPGSDERPYAGSLSLGLHTHFMRGQTEFSLGGDLVVTGPQTHLDDLQLFLHDRLGGGKPSRQVRRNQIRNGLHPTLVAEIGQDLQFSENVNLRPFTEMRLGAETMVRVGADFTFGQIGQGEMLVREVTTGQRYRTIRDAEPVSALCWAAIWQKCTAVFFFRRRAAMTCPTGHAPVRVCTGKAAKAMCFMA